MWAFKERREKMKDAKAMAGIAGRAPGYLEKTDYYVSSNKKRGDGIFRRLFKLKSD
jgi:hypothetical protein